MVSTTDHRGGRLEVENILDSENTPFMYLLPLYFRGRQGPLDDSTGFRAQHIAFAVLPLHAHDGVFARSTGPERQIATFGLRLQRLCPSLVPLARLRPILAVWRFVSHVNFPGRIRDVRLDRCNGKWCLGSDKKRGWLAWTTMFE